MQNAAEARMDDAVVRRYWEKNARAWTLLSRAGYDVCRDYQTAPAFFKMLPDVHHLTGLDIGCGEGHNTRQLAQRGARVIALDLAAEFVRAARDYQPAGPVRYLIASALQLPFPAASFDFITAFMSFMDIAAPERFLPEVVRVLKPGAFLQFSILHPCFCPMHRRVIRNEAGIPAAVELARYFDRVNGEIERWIFSAAPAEAKSGLEFFEIPRFHRTLADWINLLVAAGLNIEHCVEPTIDPVAPAPNRTLEDTRIAPNFLLLRCRRSK